MSSPKQEHMKNDRFMVAANKDGRSLRQPRAPVRSVSSNNSLGNFLAKSPKKDNVDSDEVSRGAYSTVSKMFRRQKKTNKEPTQQDSTDPAYLKKLDGFLSQKATSSRRMDTDDQSRGAYSTASKIRSSSRYPSHSKPSKSTKHAASSRHLSSSPTPNIPSSVASSRHLASRATKTERLPARPTRTTSSSVLSPPNLTRAATKGTHEEASSPRRKNRKIVCAESTRQISSPRRVKMQSSLSNFESPRISSRPSAKPSKLSRHSAGDAPIVVDSSGELKTSSPRRHVSQSASPKSHGSSNSKPTKHRARSTGDAPQDAPHKPSSVKHRSRSGDGSIASNSVAKSAQTNHHSPSRLSTASTTEAVTKMHPKTKSNQHRSSTSSVDDSSVEKPTSSSKSSHGASKSPDRRRRSSASKSPDSRRRSGGSKSVTSRSSKNDDKHRRRSKSRPETPKHQPGQQERRPSHDGGDFNQISNRSRKKKKQKHSSDTKSRHRSKKDLSGNDSQQGPILKTSHLRRSVDPERRIDRTASSDTLSSISGHQDGEKWRPTRHMKRFSVQKERSMERFESSNDDEIPVGPRRQRSRTGTLRDDAELSSSLHHRIPKPQRRCSSFYDDDEAISDAILAASTVDESSQKSPTQARLLDEQREDIFTHFSWSQVPTTDDDRVKEERQKLRDSIRDTVFFQAYERALLQAKPVL